MGLELDWTDETTGVTYQDAYVIIDRVVYEKGANNNYSIIANVYIYKDATAYNSVKPPL